MQRQLMVLVVEDADDERRALAECIEAHDELRLVGVTGDEDRAFELVADSLPDAMVLDLALTDGSGGGLGLLRRMRQTPPPVRPYILVTTSNSSTDTNAVAHDYGADYILSKYQRDYSAGLVTDHLLAVRETLLRRPAQAARPESSPSQRRRRLEERISEELDLVGISPKMKGRRYLETGIRIMVQSPTQRLCAAIAAEAGKTEASVERAVKNAIDKAWTYGDTDALLHYTARIDPERGVPTTTEFICHYADRLRREHDDGYAR